MMEEVKKVNVEKMLGYSITDSEFAEALESARKKQAYIYARDQRAVIMQPWYLTKLTEEQVRSFALSKFTMALCGLHFGQFKGQTKEMVKEEEKCQI